MNNILWSMTASAEKVQQLRKLLADQFGAHRAPQEEVYHTGLPVLDEIGVPRASLTEIVSSTLAGPAGGVLLYALLHSAILQGERVILIDGKDAFAPKGLPQLALNRLLWARCSEAAQAIKTADLAVRDGNIDLVVLFLTLNPLSEFRRIPATAWHRLQMLAEKSGTTVLVFSPSTQVGCSRLRIVVKGALPLAKFAQSRNYFLPSLNIHVERQRQRRGPEQRFPL